MRYPIALLISCTTIFTQLQANPMPNPKPNVLLINVDDLGWTDLGFMGSSFYETPNIDHFASQGSVFTRAYAAAANCAPSRACMLTGLQPSRHGIYTVGSSERGDAETRRLIPIQNHSSIPENIPTLASAFKSEGYSTGIVGKWHISNDPLKHGFEENIAGGHSGHPGSYFSPYHIDHLIDGPEGEYLPERLSQEACRYIKNHQDRPFFLYFATYLVHTPLQAKEERIAYFKQKGEKLKDPNHHNPVYAAMIEALDQSIGKVLEALQQTGQEDNTIVIFISDNGGIRAISNQSPLRAGKGSAYEGGIRVPMAMRWPNHIKAGSMNATPIRNMDFFPSLISLCGGSNEGRLLDGEDLSANILNPESNTTHNRPMLWHFPVYLEAYRPAEDDGRDPLFRTRPGTVLTQGDWKLHYYYEDNAYELYHLPSDLGERQPCQDQNPEVLNAMKKTMDSELKKYKLPIPTKTNPAFSAQKTAQLENAVHRSTPTTLTKEEDWYRVLQFID